MCVQNGADPTVSNPDSRDVSPFSEQPNAQAPPSKRAREFGPPSSSLQSYGSLRPEPNWIWHHICPLHVLTSASANR